MALPSKFTVHQYCADVTSVVIERVEEELQLYDMGELTNENVNNKVEVVEAHPISTIGGMFAENQDISTMIPSIGVVWETENPASKQLLGSGSTSRQILKKSTFEANYKNKDMKERWRDGILISQPKIDAIDQHFTDNPGLEEIQHSGRRALRDTTLKISIWSHHPTVTRVLAHIMRSVCLDLRIVLQPEYKLQEFSGVGNLYNYDFGQTLFGYDWNLKLFSETINRQFDLDVKILKTGEEAVATGIDALDDPDANPTFGVLGRDDKLPEGDL